MYFLDSFVVFLLSESPKSSGNPVVESSELKTSRNPESRIPNPPEILFGPNPRFQKSPRQKSSESSVQIQLHMKEATPAQSVTEVGTPF